MDAATLQLLPSIGHVATGKSQEHSPLEGGSHLLPEQPDLMARPGGPHPPHITASMAPKCVLALACLASRAFAARLCPPARTCKRSESGLVSLSLGGSLSARTPDSSTAPNAPSSIVLWSTSVTRSAYAARSSTSARSCFACRARSVAGRGLPAEHASDRTAAASASMNVGQVAGSCSLMLCRPNALQGMSVPRPSQLENYLCMQIGPWAASAGQ